MAVTQQEANQIAQLLGQFQDVAQFVIEAGLHPNQTAAAITARLNVQQNLLGGAAFGMTALAFVYTYDAVVKEENFPAAILTVVDLIPLNIVRNNAMAGESPEQACLRHLRNCFAHGRFQITVANNNTTIALHDENQAHNATFDAQCDAEYVISLAERLLVASYDHVAAIALAPQQAAASAAGPVPAAQPPPAAQPGVPPPPAAGPGNVGRGGGP